VPKNHITHIEKFLTAVRWAFEVGDFLQKIMPIFVDVRLLTLVANINSHNFAKTPFK